MKNLQHIASSLFRDKEGCFYIFHSQKGKISIDPNSRFVRTSLILDVLLRIRRRIIFHSNYAMKQSLADKTIAEKLIRIAKRLEGDGWFASHALDVGYQ